jgi:tRNA threonylcarbamoyladenosine biosynthesis protein TsaB
MAVFDGGGALLFGRVWDGEPTRSPEWVAELAQGLAENGVSVDQLDGFVCGLGPGSFSGIRACLSALQGLALPGNKPVYGVASAAALALGLAERAECVTVIGDARRSRIWSVTYRVDAASQRVRLYNGGAPTHTSDDFLLTPAEALSHAVPAGSLIASSDWERLSGLLGSTFAAERLVAHAVFPKASDIGRLALSEPTARVLEPLPVYLHPAVAEK